MQMPPMPVTLNSLHISFGPLLAKAALALCTTLQVHAATPLVLTCPARLQLSESTQPPAGWQLVPGTEPRAFAGLGVYSGPPQEMASLVPDTQRRKGKQVQSVWRFNADSDQHWLACSYRQTAAQLGQRLPAGLRQCTAMHSPGTRPTDLQASPELRCE